MTRRIERYGSCQQHSELLLKYMIEAEVYTAARYFNDKFDTEIWISRASLERAKWMDHRLLKAKTAVLRNQQIKHGLVEQNRIKWQQYLGLKSSAGLLNSSQAMKTF